MHLCREQATFQMFACTKIITMEAEILAIEKGHVLLPFFLNLPTVT